MSDKIIPMDVIEYQCDLCDSLDNDLLSENEFCKTCYFGNMRRVPIMNRWWWLRKRERILALANDMLCADPAERATADKTV